MRVKSRVAAFTAWVMVLSVVPLAEAQEMEQGAPATTQSNGGANDVLTLLGSDGKVRSTEPTDDPSIQGRKLVLQPGDTVEITEDGTQADLVNADGLVVGSFLAPTLIHDDGTEVEGRFSTYQDLLLVSESGAQSRSACTKAKVGKWTYRVGAAGVCGAFTAGTGGLGGAICALGADAAEDFITFDSVC